MSRIAGVAAATLLLAAPAAAQAPSLQSLTEGGRYALLELNDQVVRLDTDTGAFSLCRMENDVWSCMMTVDERQQFNEQIAALTRRIEALEQASGTAPVAALSGIQPDPQAQPPVAAVPPAPANAGGAPSQEALAPLAEPTAVPDAPTIQEDFVAPEEKKKKEHKGLFRRLTGLIPFVD